MLAAIEFDDQFFIYANKINNIRTYRVLAPEFGTVQTLAAQLLPDFAFGIGFGFSEFAGEGFAALGIALQRLPLTLALSPRVRGERGLAIGNFMTISEDLYSLSPNAFGERVRVRGNHHNVLFQCVRTQQRRPKPVLNRRPIPQRQAHWGRIGRHLDVGEHRAGLAMAFR